MEVKKVLFAAVSFALVPRVLISTRSRNRKEDKDILDIKKITKTSVRHMISNN